MRWFSVQSGFMAMALLALCVRSARPQGQILLDVIGSTPVGSWQLREQTVTKEDGSKRVLSIKTSHVAEETRGGEPWDWIELEMKLTRVNKKGKAEEDPPIIAKLLLRRWYFQLDAGNVLLNPASLAQEVILQEAGKPPVRFYGKGLEKVRGLLGLENKFKWTQVGSEPVSISAGTFDSVHLHGEGTADTKALLRKVQVGTTADFWYCMTVPFSHVRGEIKNPNGKSETWISELKSFGASGAVSQITGKPSDDTGKSRFVKIFGD